MHIIFSALLLLAAYFKGNWREWEKYHLTIFYVIICNLLYNHLCQNKLLWEYVPDFQPKSHILVDLLYSFLNLPAITLLFLTFYPFKGSGKKKLSFFLLWIGASTLIEYPFYKYGRLQLQHGYEFWMEPFFYTAMYGCIRLHYSRPFVTYFVSVFIIIFMMWTFQISVK
jgi:hypothetical protein